MQPVRGEVGWPTSALAGKVRPALVVSVAFGDQDRALLTLVPHTTALRGSQFGIGIPVPFLKPGAFLVQGVTTLPVARAIQRIGKLQPAQFDRVFSGLLQWLGHSAR